MKISIITPSYNQGEFIERTLLSVLGQYGTFDLEYIIIDGASTDETIDILKRYEQKVNQGEFDGYQMSLSYIWISEKDKGQSDAINKGLKLSTGDIVAYLNSDDTFEPGSLQIVYEYLGKSQNMRSYGKCKIINKQDREIRKLITWYKNLIGKNYSYEKLLTENFISQMTVFWKKEIIDELGVFDQNEHLCMDYEYWLRIGKKYDPIYIDSYIANFRFYRTSKSGSRFVKQFDDELRIAKNYAGNSYILAMFFHKINYYKIIIAYKILEFLKI